MNSELVGVILILYVIFLGGCSINGSYIDYSGSDAVKIRFIADTKNSTMAYLDAQHCSGLTTGMLNNLFVKNTSRRADMRVAAPAETSGYLEIKVPPGKEIFLLANSMDTYGTTCGAMRRLVGAAGEEYELLLKQLGRNCGVGLYRLEQVAGIPRRIPQPMQHNQSFPPCAGKSPFFPAE